MRSQAEERRSTLSRIAGEGTARSAAGEGGAAREVVAAANPIVHARALRRNSTDAERHLWSAWRDRRPRGYRFRRQFPIGPFIVDFACTKYLLIVEADGGQHANNKRDVRRTAWLECRGWRVLRFWDNEILTNIGGVSEAILAALRERQALTLPRLRRGSLPLPQCGRGEASRQLQRP